MNRRRFLQLVTGAGVSTVTMAEAGFVADFFNWLRRKPVHSIPPPRKHFTLHDYTYYWADAQTGRRLSPDIVAPDYTNLEQLAAIYWDQKVTIKLNNPEALKHANLDSRLAGALISDLKYARGHDRLRGRGLNQGSRRRYERKDQFGLDREFF